MKTELSSFRVHGSAMLNRPELLNDIKEVLERSRIVTITGPRQSGKTAMAREFVSPDSMNHFNPEDPVTLS